MQRAIKEHFDGKARRAELGILFLVLCAGALAILGAVSDGGHWGAVPTIGVLFVLAALAGLARLVLAVRTTRRPSRPRRTVH